MKVKKTLLRYKLNEIILTWPDIPVILYMIRNAEKGWSNVYEELLVTNSRCH